MNRYIKTADRKIVDNESCFKCAWCGTTLFERHHIEPYALNGLNSADNLILLCPNCHTDVHNGTISEKEINERKKQLNGFIDKSSGCLSITDTPIFILGGARFDGGIERILVHKNYDYIKIENLNNNLLISLRIFDKDGKLICWMSKNRWWLENNDILEFIFQKNLFYIKSNEIESLLHMEIDKNIIRVKCKMYVNGDLIEFKDEGIFLGKNVFRIGSFTGNKTAMAISV
ncbi:MAG: HNH endonuclease [Parachlamydiales bacterium]|jgi:hypothetical protein